MTRPIGVFDSGIGGLTVVKELMEQLPYEDIVYLGDTARVPYGTKSESTVVRFTLENTIFLLKQEVKLIVIACNTASSIALGVTRKHFKIPIIGVILPGAKEAVYATLKKRIGVIGTPATIRSKAYDSEIKTLDPSIEVISCPAPLFVPLVEEGWFDENVTFQVAKKYLSPLKKFGVDTLILGCTHYPLLKSVIKKVMGKDVVLVDSAKQVACEVKEILANQGMLSSKRKRSDIRRVFYVTDAPQNFSKLAERFLGYPLSDVRKAEYYV
jgi:glutamate racemase